MTDSGTTPPPLPTPTLGHSPDAGWKDTAALPPPWTPVPQITPTPTFAGPGPGPTYLAQPVPMPDYRPTQQMYGSHVTVAAPESNVEMILAWVFTVLTGLYMLPWAIAATRRSPNSVAVALLTFFLGWTVVGWIVALVLAFTGGPNRTVVTTFVGTTTQLPPAPVGWWASCPSDPPHLLRWWDGHQWTPHTMLA